VADYQAQIRLGIEGLGQLRTLETRLQSAVDLLGRLEKANANVGQAAQSSQRNVEAARRRRLAAGLDLQRAGRTVENVAMRRDPSTGLFLPGGANATARRLASANLRLAQREARESNRALGEEERNRRLIFAAQQRYARALDRAGNIVGGVQGNVNDTRQRVDAALRTIRRESRDNYLDLLFGGRQQRLAQEGGGRRLPANLQQQIVSNRTAFDLARSAGDLPTMSRLATELAGLVRAQNEQNRLTAGRSGAFEKARRGQEQLDVLAARPGVDDARIRRLRAQAAGVIEASQQGDITRANALARRMNASIMRYTRELDAAARDLQQQQRAGFRSLNVRQSWAAVLQDIGAEQQIRARALPSSSLLAQRVAQTGGEAPVELMLYGKEKAAAEKAEAEQKKRAAGSAKRFADAVEREAKRLERLGIGQGPVRSLGGAVPMGGQSRGGFNQLPFPAGPGNARGIAQFRAIQQQQRAGGAPQGFFQGNARKAISEGLIGGAFPLLFGQGLGASVGGAAGGVSGGLIGGSFGFGLSLIGTALGSAVDTTTNNLKELAASLKSPNDAITALEASGFRVGDSLKFQAEQLQSVGRAYDAQTLVLQEVERRLGAGSVQELNALNGEQKRLQESWAALAGEIQRALLPAVIGATGFIADLAAGIAAIPTPPAWLLRALQFATPVTLGPQALIDAARNRGRATAATAPTRVPLTPQEAFASESTRIQESRRVADQIRSAYREAFQLQRQAYDLQREGADINREIADYSYRKEREIFDLRQQVAEREIENNRAAAQNRIERSDLNARQTFAAATGFEQQLLANVREVMRTRREGEADIEQSRRKLELAIARLSRDVEDYKRTNAREIEDIERRKLAYTRSVEDYKMNVADYVLQRAREAADFMRQAMTLPEVGGGGAVGGLAPYAPVSPLQRIPYMTEIDAAARAGNVDPRLLAGLVRQESNFRPGAVSGSGAIGLGQLMPGTAQELGVNPRDIQQNLLGAARYLRRMIDMFGSVEAGLRAYNQGPGAQQRTPAGNSRESREYPGLVLGHARRYGFNPQAAVGAPGAMPGGVVARTGATGIGSGAHLDVRWADGRPITAADADRFIRVAGKLPSSYGVTSGYGPRRAPVPGASTFHRGVDFGTPAGQPITLTGGARLTGAMTEAQSGGGGIVGIIDTPMGQMKLLHLERVLGTPQATAAAQVSNIPQPRFNPVAVGATPSAAPINAERMAVLSRMVGSEQEAQRILEEQNKLRQKGIELAQVEQILQGNQVPALEQEFAALQSKLKARRDSLGLSSNELALVDLEAESKARIARIEEERAGALAKASKQYKGADLAKAQQMINEQSKLGLSIAKAEEQQKRENLELVNQIANAQEANDLLINARKEKEVATVENAALLRGELNASAVELARLSDGYKAMSEQQKAAYELDVARTEELRKQEEILRGTNKINKETPIIGTGLRAGRIGAEARGFEEVLNQGGTPEQASARADAIKRQEDARMVWEGLEKNIVDVSNAISGGLTNGLLDVISGAKKIEDVGREVLDGIARTFADTAQQQLSTLMQRNLASMLGGPEGQLTKMLGGASATAGPQALGAASFAASNSVMAFGVALQTVTAQMGVSGALSGFGSAAAGGIGSAFSAAAPNILGGFFPGASLLPSMDFDLPDDEIGAGASVALSPSSLANGAVQSLLSKLPSIFASAFLGGASGMPNFFGGFRAGGGPVVPGKGYIVGEREPEFFFPSAAGKIVPRSDMEKAAALREGESNNKPIDLRYTVTEERGKRYVTEEQFLKSNAALAQRTQAMTYAGMRNSKQIREYTGI